LPGRIEEVQAVRGASHRKLLHLSINQPYRPCSSAEDPTAP
jgi:hypothetical protein